MIVLGIDPAIRKTGYAIIRKNSNAIIFNSNNFELLNYGVITNKPNITQAKCLLNISETIYNLCVEYKPTDFSIESIIYVQNFKTAISMGSSFGAAVIAASKYGLDINEYSPKKVKQVISGLGASSKKQVNFMVRALLNLTFNIPQDAADAIAIAITHINSNKILKTVK